MPFIVDPNDWDGWLDPGASAEQLEEMFKRASGSKLSAKASAPLVPDGSARLPTQSQGELSFN